MSEMKSFSCIDEKYLIEWTSPLIPNIEMSAEEDSAFSIEEKYKTNPDLEYNSKDWSPIKLIEQSKQIQMTDEQLATFLDEFVDGFELYKEQGSPTEKKETLVPLFSPITNTQIKRRRSNKMTPSNPPTPFYTPVVSSSSYPNTRRRLSYDMNIKQHPHGSPQLASSSFAVNGVPKSWVDLYHQRPEMGASPRTISEFTSKVVKVAYPGVRNSKTPTTRRNYKMPYADKENIN